MPNCKRGPQCSALPAQTLPGLFQIPGTRPCTHPEGERRVGRVGQLPGGPPRVGHLLPVAVAALDGHRGDGGAAAGVGDGQAQPRAGALEVHHSHLGRRRGGRGGSRADGWHALPCASAGWCSGGSMRSPAPLPAPPADTPTHTHTHTCMGSGGAHSTRRYCMLMRPMPGSASCRTGGKRRGWGRVSASRRREGRMVPLGLCTKACGGHSPGGADARAGTAAREHLHCWPSCHPAATQPPPACPPTLAKARDCTSMWSASHSGQESEIMAMMDSGLPALSVLHTPAGWGRGKQGAQKFGTGAGAGTGVAGRAAMAAAPAGQGQARAAGCCRRPAALLA